MNLIATSNFSDEIPITLTYPNLILNLIETNYFSDVPPTNPSHPNLIPNLILTSNFSEEPHQPSTTQLDSQLDFNQQLQ